MEQETQAPHAGSLVLGGLALGALADLLLYGQDLGLGWSLFLLALPSAFLLLLRHNRLQPAWGSLLPLLGVYAFFATFLSLRDSEFVTGLNVTVCLFLLGLIARFGLVGQLSHLRLGVLLGAPFVLLGNLAWRAGAPVHAVLSTARHAESRRRLGPVLRGLLLSLPVLLVLVPLLSAADAIFAQKLGTLAQLFRPERWTEQGVRLFWALLTAWLTVGGLALALVPPPLERPLRTEEEHPLGFVEGLTVLTSVALVFGAFLTIQLTYLFGGAARVLAVPGLTYAQYARRGFFELVTVAVLTLVLILGLKALTRRTRPAERTGFSALASLLIAQTLVLLASAWQRMAVYESAYGATPTRIHVDTFLLWLGAALLWLGVTLWSRRWAARFAIGGLICALGFVATLDLIDPDSLAAHRNLVRAQTTGRL